MNDSGTLVCTNPDGNEAAESGESGNGPRKAPETVFFESLTASPARAR
jgi:hypothetical protein